MEELSMRKARSVYRKLTEAIAENGWKYKADDDKLIMVYGIKSEEKEEPVNFIVKVDAERQLILLETRPIITFNADVLISAAEAVCTANVILADGCFDLKLKSCELIYRQALSFRSSTNLSVGAIKYLLSYSVFAVNSFLGKLKLVNDGKISGAEFTDACKDIM